MMDRLSAGVNPIGITQQVRQNRTWTRLSVLLASVILSLIMFPSFQALFNYRITRFIMVLWILWVIVVTLERPHIWSRVLGTRFVELMIYTTWCYIFLVYDILSPYDLVPGGGGLIKLLYRSFQIILCYIIALVYTTENNKNICNCLVRLLFFGFGVNALISMPVLLKPELAGRAFSDYYMGIRIQGQSFSHFGLGNIGLYITEAMLMPIFVSLVLKTRGIKVIAYWAVLALIVASILLCTLSVAILILIIDIFFFALILMFNRRVSRRTYLVIIIFIILVIIIGFQLSKSKALQYSINKALFVINPSYSSIKFTSIERRIEKYVTPIKTFMKFPLLGAGIAQVSNGLGGHSGILDGFALFGILFSIYLVFLWIKYCHLHAMFQIEANKLWAVARISSFIGYLIAITFDHVLFLSIVSGAFFFCVIGSTPPIKKVKWFNH